MEDEKRLRKLRKRAAEYGCTIRRYENGYNFLKLNINAFLYYGAMSLDELEQVLDEWDAQDNQDGDKDND